MRFTNVATGLLVTATGLFFAAGPAEADPQEGLVVEVSCQDGNTYTMIASAAQTWNAQLVTDSTSVFHLTWYEITFLVTQPDGTVEQFGPDEYVKGGNDRTGKDLVDCTFAFDVDLGEGRSAHVFGPARGWLTPAS